MSEARKLLLRALDVLEEMRLTDCPDWELGDDIRAELEKPEPVECGWIDVRPEVFLNGWIPFSVEDGKYRLLAEKIQDDQKI
jgi:hypothetical protein